MPLIDVSTGSVIKEVKARPVIWDTSHPLYKMKSARGEAWHEVFCTLIPEFESLDKAHQKETDRAIQQRWKTARDAYMRCKSQIRNGSLKRRYFYYPNLQFLEKLHEGDAEFNSDSQQESRDDPLTISETLETSEINIKVERESDSDSGEKEQHYEPVPEIPEKIRKQKPKQKRQMKRKFIKVLDRRLKVPIEVPNRVKQPLLVEVPCKTSQQPMEDNDNMSFFMSMLPIVNKFSDQQKLIFRSEVIRVAMEISSKNTENYY